MKKRYTEDDSENEFSVDEPEEFQESSDDWTPGGDSGKSNRKQTRRLRSSNSKKPRLVDPSSSSEEESEEIDSEEEDSKKKRPKGRSPGGRGRPPKKNIEPKEPKEPKESKEPVVSCEATSTTSPVQKEFSSGAYVVLKTDFQNGGDPPIWKIDGKALLQKYIPFEQNGQKLYKNTSTYSGWSITNKDLYYPAPISFKVQNRKEIIVEFHKDQIKPSDHGDDSE
ncbi:hypothetical protein R5R35_000394 [Gryllus longicercus]|uniref:Uncharacterized protein n=1 Tax=Gryllus longicercus TaxID=2509291 RepID=A0AAN9VNB8_9ORTH